MPLCFNISTERYVIIIEHFYSTWPRNVFRFPTTDYLIWLNIERQVCSECVAYVHVWKKQSNSIIVSVTASPLQFFHVLSYFEIFIFTSISLPTRGSTLPPPVSGDVRSGFRVLRTCCPSHSQGTFHHRLQLLISPRLRPSSLLRQRSGTNQLLATPASFSSQLHSESSAPAPPPAETPALPPASTSPAKNASEKPVKAVSVARLLQDPTTEPTGAMFIDPSESMHLSTKCFSSQPFAKYYCDFRCCGLVVLKKSEGELNKSNTDQNNPNPER